MKKRDLELIEVLLLLEGFKLKGGDPMPVWNNPKGTIIVGEWYCGKPYEINYYKFGFINLN